MICRKCSRDLPEVDFYKAKRTGKYDPDCKKCHLAHQAHCVKLLKEARRIRWARYAKMEPSPEADERRKRYVERCDKENRQIIDEQREKYNKKRLEAYHKYRKANPDEARRKDREAQRKWRSVPENRELDVKRCIEFGKKHPENKRARSLKAFYKKRYNIKLPERFIEFNEEMHSVRVERAEINRSIKQLKKEMRNVKSVHNGSGSVDVNKHSCRSERGKIRANESAGNDEGFGRGQHFGCG